jgi:hypothetical protein
MSSCHERPEKANSLEVQSYEEEYCSLNFSEKREDGWELFYRERAVGRQRAIESFPEDFALSPLLSVEFFSYLSARHVPSGMLSGGILSFRTGR